MKLWIFYFLRLKKLLFSLRPHRGGFGQLFRTHLFVTAGNVLGNFDFNRNRNFSRSVDEALHNFRLSYGIGLALKLGGIARVELNYCIPIRAQRGDRPAPGLQLGVGVNFLWFWKNFILVYLSLLDCSNFLSNVEPSIESSLNIFLSVFNKNVNVCLYLRIIYLLHVQTDVYPSKRKVMFLDFEFNFIVTSSDAVE